MSAEANTPIGRGVYICPRCGSENVSIIDSRPAGDSQRRRRKCNSCETRWSTIELFLYEGRYDDLRTDYDIRRSLEGLEELIEKAGSYIDRIKAATAYIIRKND